MKLLLDTHALLWFALDDSKLSQTADGLILDPANEIWISAATHWELAIKISIGKYSLPSGITFTDFAVQAIDNNGFRILPIQVAHTALLATMPFHHRDPFDRLIVAQAIAEGMDILSADGAIDRYDVMRRW